MRSRFIIQSIFTALLIALIALVNGSTIATLRSPKAELPNQTPDSRSPASHPDARPENILALFTSGTQPQTIAVDPPATSPAWISQAYKIELKGTVAGQTAIVKDLLANKEILLHPDDVIRGGKISSITRNQLILDGEFGRETLSLPADPHAPPTSSTAQNPTPSRTIRREDLANVLRDVGKLAEEISLQPVRAADGGSAGYRVTALKPQGAIAKMGLRKNDLLASVNGQKIATPEDVYRVLDEASHGAHLTIAIRRDQADVQLDIDIQ